MVSIGMNPNPYQPPSADFAAPDDPAARYRLIRMKYLLRVTFGALTLGFFAGVALLVCGLTGASTPAYLAMALVIVCAFITVIGNCWLLGSSLVYCARHHLGYGYLVSSLVLPAILGLLICGRHG